MPQDYWATVTLESGRPIGYGLSGGRAAIVSIVEVLDKPKVKGRLEYYSIHGPASDTRGKKETR